MDDTLRRLSELSGVDIPEEEYGETPGRARKTPAQLADAAASPAETAVSGSKAAADAGRK
jgi:hypothetical protein